jgi:hypothetical protein
MKGTSLKEFKLEPHINSLKNVSLYHFSKGQRPEMLITEFKNTVYSQSFSQTLI